MHPFLRKILEATRLTREGRIGEATAAIRAAVAPAAQRSAVVDDGDVAIAAPAPRRVDRAEGRFIESSFTGSAGTRAFKLFVPGGREGEALPLVVMLHGCTQGPDDFAAGTRMNAIAEQQGFLVLYPTQSQRANGQRCWNWFSPRHQRRGSGEPALIAAMTRHVVQTHDVDRDRVWVAGLSAGGAMAAILAREDADVFAAAGVHSGIVPGAARDVASAFAVMRSGPGTTSPLASRAAPADAASPTRRSAPLIVFHGDADTTVAIANADALLASAIADLAVVATTTRGVAERGERAFRRTVWHRSDDDGAPSVAERWVVHGSPHAWSGGAAGGSFTDPAGPDASREMLRFFAEHPRVSSLAEAFGTST